MKKILLFVALIVTTLSCTQVQSDCAEANSLQIIEDKMAIKEVVDVFSNLADTKEIDKQVYSLRKTEWFKLTAMVRIIIRFERTKAVVRCIFGIFVQLQYSLSSKRTTNN